MGRVDESVPRDAYVRAIAEALAREDARGTDTDYLAEDDYERLARVAVDVLTPLVETDTTERITDHLLAHARTAARADRVAIRAAVALVRSDAWRDHG